MEIFRKYGVQTTVYFPLITRGVQDYKQTPTLAIGDCKSRKDGGALGNTTFLPAENAIGSKILDLVLNISEMQAKQIQVRIIDQTAPKEWEDQMLIITTYGHASAQMPFDLSIALQSLHTDYNAAKTAAQAGDAMALTNAAFEVNRALSILAQVNAGTTVKLHSDYDAAKAAAPAGAEMDLVNVPNATAITAIQAGLTKLASTIDGAVDLQTALRIALAMANGKISKAGDVYTFYKQDNTTALFTLTIAASSRTRS